MPNVSETVSGSIIRVNVMNNYSRESPKTLDLNSMLTRLIKLGRRHLVALQAANLPCAIFCFRHFSTWLIVREMQGKMTFGCAQCD
jgi:hypothetical protein